MCRYPQCLYLIYNNRSEFKLYFEYLGKSYGKGHKPTMVKKNPWGNAVLECMRQVLGQMLCTAEINMAESVTLNDDDVFLDNATWAICSTYHTVLNLAGNVNILDVFKRLILKTCLCVVLTCQPNTANMLPTSQLLMFFIMKYVVSCC